ncbi:isomerase [Lithospermum erythrorhizon]|uniref:Isomerase n=1 Tax=Lithospermum erythrorhizon TaxID=34254 RepID=A0AAV3R9Z9_LITER
MATSSLLYSSTSPPPLPPLPIRTRLVNNPILISSNKLNIPIIKATSPHPLFPKSPVSARPRLVNNPILICSNKLNTSTPVSVTTRLVNTFIYSNKLTTQIIKHKKTTFAATSSHNLLSKFGYRKLGLLRTNVGKTEREVDELLVGEDSAEFEFSKQKIESWVYFGGVLGVVLFVLNFVWIDNSTGFGKSFIDAVSSLTDSPEVVMLSLILIFAIVHSGLASLRDGGEKLIGERAYRVLFAGVSLPLAVSTIVYFINHRYDGMQLWQLQGVPGLHQFVWLFNFISFFFLYPSTFNLLEVAAVDKPKMHLWETGIMRITRHPQMVGQVMWCLAHTLWIGNSVAVAASVGLIGHHLFGAWNGDRRLGVRYGKAFEAVESRTSIIPFAAILDGRQKLPKDYYKEFIRLPYLTITFLTLGAYFAHPLMQAASYRLHW